MTNNSSFQIAQQDMLFALHVVGTPTDTRTMLADLIGPAARLAEAELLPLDPIADRVGARYADGQVVMPPGFVQFYRQWVEGGWNNVDVPEDWGGLGLPVSVAAPLMEAWTSACMAFGLAPVLTQGAMEVLLEHGDDALRKRWMGPLVAGTCMATMALTEPGAGSDLNLIRTRAERGDDGQYRLFGQKIFITYGEHDLTDNILHLVLARLPDAPIGSKGLSLFLVPKWLLGEGDRPGQRNDVQCLGIEHKLGLHGSPTCTMAFGEGEGAIGWIIGREHQGLACMFTMMNRARLATGLQAVAVAERATQAALSYARQRCQGSPQRGMPPGPIIAHPDVRRMLTDMRARTMVIRLIAYKAALAIDSAHGAAEGAERQAAQQRASLLTPIVKAFCSDSAIAVTSTAIQVHGGAGYVEETGVAQYWRDVRITAIYEGTNGIQAIDLVQRKIVQAGGTALMTLIDELRSDAAMAAAAVTPLLRDCAPLLTGALDAIIQSVGWLLAEQRSEGERLAAATPFLDMLGRTLGGALLLRAACLEPDPATPADIGFLAASFCWTHLAAVPASARLVCQGDHLLPPLSAWA
ncbi:acyl-CoA dehydrogenase [Niveispirillum sp. SYP-B3756]|uniref:acyl-CoA dehydrogenase n=1 Tax=Niveispirillum sp. SYP-B3756 TaxID=2662178 RepID=UPI0015663A1D|nr:acyl-CoA dehydrogenase [Niveispirillum sp. SYP-B3756]